MPRTVILACALVTALIAAGVSVRADAPTDGIEFYEKKIRPLLADNCYQCHGPGKQKSNLRLDSSAAIRKGGDRGPALVAGDPEKSTLILAVRYLDQELRMPPRSKLSDEQVADLVAWVKMGAPLPKDQVVTVQPLKTFDLAERKQHWCYQPVRPLTPPMVENRVWPRNAVDAFVLARLEAAGLKPAAPADRRVLVRRVTFDLLGLPPTPAEVEVFVADESPDAYERLVDRLLASPPYGERWGRHWLDLVRYAETLGHEFDYDIHHAWRYRDYVVRTFNQDVPYDQFVLEHLAGDLLPEPRREPRTGFNESVVGTACFWLGEQSHSPVDVRQHEADRIDNQIDVFGKTFLAQTIACARCHDHKFDAIAAKDYYALAGYLKSSRYQQAFLDAPERVETKKRELARLKHQMRHALADAAEKELDTLPHYLPAARRVVAKEATTPPLAKDGGLDTEILQRWVKALQSPLAVDHPLYLWASLGDPTSFDKQWPEIRRKLDAAAAAAEESRHRSELLADFRSTPTTRWFFQGNAHEARPSGPGDFVVGRANDGSLRFLPTGLMHSGLFSQRLEGTLQSPTFTLTKRNLLVFTAGFQGRINVVVDGLTIIRDPIYGPLSLEVNDEQPRWRVLDVSMWPGKRAYLEFSDSTTPYPSHNLTSQALAGQTDSSFIAVGEIRLCDAPVPPLPAPNALALELAGDAAIKSMDDLAARYRTVLAEVLPAWREGKSGLSPVRASAVELLGALIEQGLLGRGAADSISQLADQYRQIEATIPAPVRAPALADGTGEDERVFLRGNYKTLGERAPRRLPEAIGGGQQPEPTHGSGRLELARRLVDPANPLTARVLVNRLWHHHFGAGLVRSVDDFGRMGEAPSHPELLDYLAGELVRRRWSIKDIHRLMLLSNTYRMASSSEPKCEQADPQNRLLHRMPVRRLEAEAIRDAILSVSGRLDRRMEGPSVPPHLTPYMEGRGRPGASGPLDGNGRRSIYLNVRRNFLNPMFLAYDYPIPFTTVGRRTVSNVPAQALTLMNDPFALQQAQLWARRTMDEKERPADRLTSLYLTAFSRPPTGEEVTAALEFLAEQGQRHGAADERAWTDLCHVLLNVKEFVFVE